jgi:hypothetical protein
MFGRVTLVGRVVLGEVVILNMLLNQFWGICGGLTIVLIGVIQG